MKTWPALLLACLALMVAGCGGDDDDDGGEGGGGGGAETTRQQADAEVTMKGIAFEPGVVTVREGGTVVWTNDDSVDHDVTGDDFKSGDAGAMENGDTFAHTFDTAGTFDYVCTAHPGMEGTVTVQ
jgi:plastocyanin